MIAVFSRSASAFLFTVAVLVAIIAVVFGANAMPTASKLKLAAKNSNNNKEVKIDHKLPPIINWIERGVVGPAKEEGQCGNADIFATVSNIEAINAIVNNGNFTGLSTEQFMKCMKGGGCNGMEENGVQKYLAAVGGYVAANTTQIPSSCTNFPAAARVIAFKNIIADETALHAELVNGPINVAVDAASWEFYTGGVLANCPANSIDHNALLVGINVADEKNAYWLLQNSWGSSFGENGNIMIKYGSNQCGLITDATSVDVAKN